MNYSSFNYPSPIGVLNISFTNRGIMRISFHDNVKNKNENIIRDKDYLYYKTIYKQFNEYFTGKRQIFEIPIFLRGTDFQKKVWHELLKIPYGAKKSYKEVAKAVGNPDAQQAVGNANNRNPIPIIIPCHRVVGSDGKIRGYSGGNDKQKWLLVHENKYRKDECNGKRISFKE